MNIVFDIGGSRMRFAKVVAKDKLSQPLIVKTPDNYMDAIAEFKNSVDELSGGQSVDKLVGGIAGVFNKEGTQLELSPNLKQWEGKPLVNDISRMTGSRKVILKNDTDMTGLGEAVYGAGRDHEIVAYMTFSTGIGGSLIVNQEIAPYRFGFEPGWQIIDHEELETLHNFSGAALKERYDGKLFKDIKAELTRARIVQAIAVGIHNTTVYWSPDVIVLGGGMTEAIKIEEIYQILEKLPLRFPELPEIKFTELGEFGESSGLYGGLALLRD